MPLRCGRLDTHDRHDWSRPHSLYGPSPTYACTGHVITEGGYTRDADKAQDDAEELAIRERREVA